MIHYQVIQITDKQIMLNGIFSSFSKAKEYSDNLYENFGKYFKGKVIEKTEGQNKYKILLEDGSKTEIFIDEIEYEMDFPTAIILN